MCEEKLEDMEKLPKKVEKQISELRVECQHCTKETSRGSWDWHVREECEVECGKGCGLVVLRSEREKHEEVCTNKMVECKGKEFGCEWVGKLGERERHERGCLAGQHVQLREAFEELRVKNEKYEYLLEELHLEKLMERKKEEEAKKTLQGLPTSLLCYLLASFLSVHDLSRVALLNKRFSQVCSSDALWRVISLQRFPLSSQLKPPHLSFLAWYKEISGFEWDPLSSLRSLSFSSKLNCLSSEDGMWAFSLSKLTYSVGVHRFTCSILKGPKCGALHLGFTTGDIPPNFDSYLGSRSNAWSIYDGESWYSAGVGSKAAATLGRVKLLFF